MSQSLPSGGFKWVENLDLNYILNVPDDSDDGCILEVDLYYPEHLHHAHNDFPFCAQSKKLPGSKHEKLLMTDDSKERYVIHYVNLKQAAKNKLKVRKVHRILNFNRSNWFKAYIDLNTDLH